MVALSCAVFACCHHIPAAAHPAQGCLMARSDLETSSGRWQVGSGKHSSLQTRDEMAELQQLCSLQLAAYSSQLIACCVLRAGCSCRVTGGHDYRVEQQAVHAVARPSVPKCRLLGGHCCLLGPLGWWDLRPSPAGQEEVVSHNRCQVDGELRLRPRLTKPSVTIRQPF